ncbi:hypothetical protein NRS6141_03913 [Bacillus subtilis]|nr:hypothetical protein KHRBS_10865 [Bacillus subtilis subsp. subtilis]CAF1850983.1 hypothetical protein NRS6141_03913 [Bacillus subtilis]CAF1914920.1 hypothetical protein NRS6204_03843 [Bacillus subtilis]CAF1916722.1 hypothetical protein NRS6205_03959 [Bacillus subtilis]
MRLIEIVFKNVLDFLPGYLLKMSIGLFFKLVWKLIKRTFAKLRKPSKSQYIDHFANNRRRKL